MKLIRQVDNIRSWRSGWAMMALAAIMLMTIAFSSCINEQIVEDPVEKPEVSEELYIYLTVTTPTNAETRSTTTSGGNASYDGDDKRDDRLQGTSNENELKSATIYLVDNNYNIKLQLDANYIDPSSGTTKLRAKLNSLSQLTDLAGKEYKILIVGNSSETSLDHNFDSNTTNSSNTLNAFDAKFSVTNLTDNPIGDFGTNGKTMPFVNENENVTLEIPGGSSPEVILNTIKGNFIPIGNNQSVWDITPTTPIDLERAIARIDFGFKMILSTDNEESTGTQDPIPQLVYPIEGTGVNVKIHSLQPFNINPNSYLFRHTAKGTPTGATEAPELFGIENGKRTDYNGYNWVAGVDWDYPEDAQDGEIEFTKTTTSSSWLNQLTTKKNQKEEDIINGVSGSEASILISKLTDRTPYSDNGKNYYSWRYITENTLPSTSYMIDKSNLIKNATGVAFTFQILNKNNEPLMPSDLDDDNKCPKNISKSTEVEDKKTIRITDENNNYIDVDLKGEKDANGKIIKEEGYFITYYGFIVHNETYTGMTAPNIPMYYGVVRNNVYQISVKSIKGLPDPHEPDNFYLSLDIRVLAWARRDITVTW